MSSHGRTHHRFSDTLPGDVPMPDLNPYLKLHHEMGRPVVTATQAVEAAGDWRRFFDRDAPLHVEIGPGNGFYLAGMAERHPEWNWLGIEIRYKRVVLCARKIQVAGVENARIARYDAWWLDDIFQPGTIAGLYVNFPDPWKRMRDRSKRLMSAEFAAWAARALAVGGTIRSKTDHRPNLDRLLAGCDGYPIELVERADDVAKNGCPWAAEDDVLTNYQSKFEKRGEPVYAMLLRRVAGDPPPIQRGADVGSAPDL